MPSRPTARTAAALAVLPLGAAAVAWSVSATGERPGFARATLTLATLWLVGFLLTRGLPPTPWTGRRPAGASLAIAAGIAAATAAAFLLGALILGALPLTEPAVSAAVTAARAQSVASIVLLAALPGAAEELFFRVGLPRVFARWPLLATPLRAEGLALVAYTAVTVAGGNVLLIIAAPLLGAICAGAYAATGRTWVPVLIHLAWTGAAIGGFPLLYG